MSRTAAIAIGRNEGKRLERCLTSLAPQVDILVYVDSGSRDNSVAFARSLGARVVELNSAEPFTAARARNAGFDALAGEMDIDLVQFIDGDCGVGENWISLAEEAMATTPELGMVTGWRRELFPDNSIYNDLCDLEWHRPAGPITACGGDMMVRREAFEQIGGFIPDVIAAEDEEFCQRLSKAGWSLLRIPEDMTQHDAAMLRFGQWWRRAERTGHGFAQVGEMHPGYFRTERIRVWVFGALTPALIVLGLFFSARLVALGVLIYAISYARTVLGLTRQGIELDRALRLSLLLSLSKLPNLQGMLRYHARKRLGRAMRIIEYK